MSGRQAIIGGAALATVLLGIGAALAHHPGSHAARQPDGRVRLEAVAMVPDACSRIAEIRPGAPAGIAPAPGSAAVTARLVREGEACAAVVSAARLETAVDVPAGERQIMLYIQAPNGSLASTERVPIR